MAAPLTPLRAVAVGAVYLAPIAGAAVALHQHSWIPLGYGAVLAVGLLVALSVGLELTKHREARRIALRAENEVHPDRGELEAEIDRLNGQIRELRVMKCWACGTKPLSPVVRLGSESGKREPDVTDATESPDPGHRGA